MARAAVNPVAALPRTHISLGVGLASCEVVSTVAELLGVGAPLWWVLARLPMSTPLRLGAVLSATLCLASLLRLLDVARPLLAVHARRVRGDVVPPALGDSAQRALTHLPGETGVIRFCAWVFVVLVTLGWAVAFKALGPGAALRIAGMSVIHAAGVAALRARLFEGWLRRRRSWLLPNVDGMRVYMVVYRRRLARAAVLVLAVGHGVWLWLTEATVGVGGADLGAWGWPALAVALVFWARSLRRRTRAIEAYFDLVYRRPSTRGPSRDEPAAVPAFKAAQGLPYRLSSYLVVSLALTFLAAVALGRWWLRFDAQVAARLLIVGVVVVLAAGGFTLMLLRRVMNPYLRHLGSRHHLPLGTIRAPVGLGGRLAVVLASFGACLAGPWVLVHVAPGPASLLPGLVGLLLATGLALLFVRDTVAPLTALELRSEEMARGELARPVSPAGEADEIGRLTVAFEEMRRALRDRLRSTESINVDLEREVRRRTEALEKRNTELAEALEKLHRAQDDLVRSEKLASMGRLVAGIAHEINNPVNAVINTLEPLTEQLDEIERAAGAGDVLALSRDAKDMLGVIRRGAARTRAIVRALHNYSRGDDQQFRSVDLGRVVNDTLDLLRHQLREVDVHVDVPSPCEVWAVPGQIDQVVMNVVVNAAQALTGRKGRISIRVVPTDDTWDLFIADDGPGIPKDVLPKIFDPFFTTKNVGEGAGLGLSIVHGIIERHGGTVRVDSGDEGTTFVLSLPLRARDPSSAAG